MKYCKNCSKLNENPLLKLCRSCTYENSSNNLKQTRIKVISDKRKERLSKFSEADLFRKILIEKQNDWYLTCQYCNKSFSIEQAWPFSFCHILSKWQHKAYRLMENNIMLACSIEHHNKLDEVVNKIKKDMWKEFETLIASWKDVSDLINNYK